jgi:hypothetical protein
LRPQQTSAKDVRVHGGGAPCPDCSSRVGNGIVEPRFVGGASLQSVELMAEGLRNADGADQSRVQKPEPITAVADLAILEYRRSP